MIMGQSRANDGDLSLLSTKLNHQMASLTRHLCRLMVVGAWALVYVRLYQVIFRTGEQMTIGWDRIAYQRNDDAGQTSDTFCAHNPVKICNQLAQRFVHFYFST